MQTNEIDLNDICIDFGDFEQNNFTFEKSKKKNRPQSSFQEQKRRAKYAIETKNIHDKNIDQYLRK